MVRMSERNYEKLDELTDKEIIEEYLYLKSSKKARLTEKDMKLLYTLAKYGILYSEDALEILEENKLGRRRTRLKCLGILDSKRGLVYLGQLGRESLIELNLAPRSVEEEDKVLSGNYNQLAEEYRCGRMKESEEE